MSNVRLNVLCLKVLMSDCRKNLENGISKIFENTLRNKVINFKMFVWYLDGVY